MSPNSIRDDLSRVVPKWPVPPRNPQSPSRSITEKVVELFCYGHFPIWLKDAGQVLRAQHVFDSRYHRDAVAALRFIRIAPAVGIWRRCRSSRWPHTFSVNLSREVFDLEIGTWRFQFSGMGRVTRVIRGFLHLGFYDITCRRQGRSQLRKLQALHRCSEFWPLCLPTGPEESEELAFRKLRVRKNDLLAARRLGLASTHLDVGYTRLKRVELFGRIQKPEFVGS